VNQTWICDEGRLSYREIGAASRLRQPLVRGELGVPEVTSYADAVTAAAERLGRLRDTKGAGVVVGVASAHATNEDLFAFKRFLQAFGSENVCVAVVTGDKDEILIHEEKAPNARGARALGFGDAKGVLDRIRGGGADGVILLGHDLVHEQLLGGAEALASLDTVVVLDAYASQLQRVAHVMLPTRVVGEKLGTLTNADGRVQRVTPAVEPDFEAYSEGEVIARLGAALGLEGFDVTAPSGQADGNGYDTREISKALSASVPAFSVRDWDSVGDAGLPLVEGGE
jgi:NADH-quinone oxidoreductase subunit G